MYKRSDFTKPAYKTAEIMEILNISYSTVKNYDKQGKLPIQRTETGRRIVLKEDLLNYLDSLGMLVNDEERIKHDVIYARVSSNEQKAKGDLDRQAMFLMENCHDLQKPIILKEVGSGLNDKRKKIQELIRMVENNEVNRVFVTSQDRLTRVGFHYLETTFKLHGVEIVVANDEEKENTENDFF